MKKTLLIMLVFAMAFGLTGCGTSTPNTTTNTKEQDETQEVAAAEATAATAIPAEIKPEVILKYGELNGKDNFTTKVGYQFAKYVEELSNGRIQIDVYPNAALGDEKASLSALHRGEDSIDIFRGNTNALTEYGFKKLSIFGLPYIFKDREGMWKVLDDENLGQAFLSEGVDVGANMVGLFYTDEGARNLMMIHELYSLEDIKAKKIRVPESALMMDTMSALSAEPVPITYTELYESLKTEMIDGAENPLPGYVSNKFYEVAPYYLLSGHTYSPGIVLISEDKWNTLSDEDKKILLKAGEMASVWNRDGIEKEEESLYKKLVENGVTIIKMTAQDRAKAEQAEKIVQTSYTPGLEDLLKKILDIQRE